jgi:phage tail-like protein
MTPVDFRRQVFRSAEQWAHGLGYRLQTVAGGGFAIFSVPGFAGWVTQDDAALRVPSLAVDDCGSVFWMHRHDGQLYQVDPMNGLVEPVTSIGDAAAPAAFGRVISTRGRLWLLDLSRSRVIALHARSFQIVAEIDVTEPVDIAVAPGRLFVLDRTNIRVYDHDAREQCDPIPHRLSAPVAIGADPKGTWLYVIDGQARGFLRAAAATGAFDRELGRFDDAGTGFRPRLFVVHPDGSLFVSDGSAAVHEFAADGGYIGRTTDVSPIGAIQSLAVDARGDLFVGTETGIAGSTGTFYTRALDNGAEREELWHRLDFAADLTDGGALDVSYASTDDAGLARAVDAIFDREAAAIERVNAIEGVLGDRWQGPHALRALAAQGSPAGEEMFARPMTHSVLFGDQARRYLWIKLEMSGLSPRARASVREMRVYYPRRSYLRYLPAVYQHDTVSRDFLERFLSMFETVLGDLEATIERIPEMFDPDLTPDSFLDWLAQWLDLGIEEEWPARVKRELVRRAARLYRTKGTPAGLAEFIRVVTDTTPIIRESFDTERPSVLGDGLRLGITRIARRPVTDLPRDQRTVLGCGSILGTTHVRSTTQVPSDPFQATANRFTVLLDLPRSRFQRYERGLHRIIRDNAPAHAAYDIRLVSGAGLGPQSMLGVTTALADMPPVRLGYATLGRAICVRRPGDGPALGLDATLAGPPSDSHGAVHSDGEP